MLTARVCGDGNVRRAVCITIRCPLPSFLLLMVITRFEESELVATSGDAVVVVGAPLLLSSVVTVETGELSALPVGVTATYVITGVLLGCASVLL